MNHKFTEVTAIHPSSEETYQLLLQIDQIVHIRPEAQAETEPHHQPLAIVTLSNGETLTLKNSYKGLVRKFEEINMVVRP